MSSKPKHSGWGGQRPGAGRSAHPTKVVSVRLPTKVYTAIERWRRINIDVPSLTTCDAIRQLLVFALREQGEEL
jgi:hypothetical protein